MEDSDRGSSKTNHQEECIDLIDFCDDVDEILSNGNLHDMSKIISVGLVVFQILRKCYLHKCDFENLIH